jgi:hypothetical protein
MGELPLCIGSFDPYISISQANNKSSSCGIYRFLDPDKSLLFFFWDEASIRGDFRAYP